MRATASVASQRVRARSLDRIRPAWRGFGAVQTRTLKLNQLHAWLPAAVAALK
jgi:hypothetical protein